MLSATDWLQGRFLLNLIWPLIEFGNFHAGGRGMAKMLIDMYYLDFPLA